MSDMAESGFHSRLMYDIQPPLDGCYWLHVLMESKDWIIARLLDEKNCVQIVRHYCFRLRRNLSLGVWDGKYIMNAD